MLVVFFHGFKACNAAYFVSSFHIPLFFFLNGMTLKFDNTSFENFLVKKLKGYVVPAIGLGILCIFLDAIIKILFNIPLDNAFVLKGICNSVNQTRHLSLWFLTALFFSDIFLFCLHQKFKGNIWLMGLGSFAILSFGIVYNMYCKTPMVWNIDAAFFGVIFTYFGYLFTSKNLSFLYQPLMKFRWISLLIGLALMIGTYFCSLYIHNTTHTNLIMFSSIYGKYYLTLPCALLGSLGFTFICRGVTNFIFAYPVKFNLALLAIHQIFAIPLFKYIIAPSWWGKVANYPPENSEFIFFVFTMTLFSLILSAILYGITLITPLSYLLNKPRYPIVKKIYSALHHSA